MNIVKFLFQFLLGRRLPTTAGTLEVPGIGHPVVIRRDQYGIPYIEAQGDVGGSRHRPPCGDPA